MYPCRLCDGGRVVLRAHFALDLVALVPGARAWRTIHRSSAALSSSISSIPRSGRSTAGVVLAEKAKGSTERQVASLLGITQPAVQHAAALAREMERRGLTDAYVPVVTPPEDLPKLRRHLHPRYLFRPKGQVMQNTSAP